MERDEESGLQRHGVRYYAVWLGRWMSADPIGLGDGVNQFLYCDNNPIFKKDMSGLEPPDPDSTPPADSFDEIDIPLNATPIKKFDTFYKIVAMPSQRERFESDIEEEIKNRRQRYTDDDGSIIIYGTPLPSYTEGLNQMIKSVKENTSIKMVEIEVYDYGANFPIGYEFSCGYAKSDSDLTNDKPDLLRDANPDPDLLDWGECLPPPVSNPGERFIRYQLAIGPNGRDIEGNSPSGYNTIAVSEGYVPLSSSKYRKFDTNIDGIVSFHEWLSGIISIVQWVLAYEPSPKAGSH
jgi:RHS repeat-associated protein